MKMRFVAGVLAFCVIVGTALPSRAESASDAASSTQKAEPITDPTKIEDHYRKVLTRPEYAEAEVPDTNAKMHDWLSRFFTRIGEDFQEFSYAEQMPRFATLLMSILVAASLAGLIYVGAKLARGRGKKEIPDMTDNATEKIFRSPEFYEEELHRAIAAGDWHEAWLASWRQFLSRLESGRMVEADRSRTNREYLSQLRAQPLPVAAQTLLPSLVDAYDQFIYGRKPIAEPDWNCFQQQVNEASLMLHLGETGEPRK